MSFRKNKYLIVRNLISKELANFSYRYFLNKRMVAKTLYESGNEDQSFKNFFGSWKDTQIPNTYSEYSDILMETLLQQVKPCIEEYTGLKLIETYSYARIYKEGDILHRHKDRLSCEISATLNLGGPIWPIYLEPDSSQGRVESGVYIPSQSAGVEVLLYPGDALIYRGCELEHWREPCDSNGCTQVFLHYNDEKSLHSQDNKFDRRPHIGLPSNFKIV